MTSIIGKKQNGKTYYYLAESARVDGKPRIVSQRYLGSADEIAARLSEAGPGEPDRTRHLTFGDVAAVWSILERLGVAEIVDDVVGSRGHSTATVGTYIALATLNRVVDPCSKRKFSDWWRTTAGDRWVKLPATALDHRRFWDAMDAINESDLVEIERRVVARMIEVFAVDVSGLVLDMTNFATWIDTGNDRAPIAQRGHSKQKRSDLRIVGLGLVVSVDGGIPLVSHAYPGNKPDVTQFPTMVKELAARFNTLRDGDDDVGGTDRLTLVFDAGQNSQDNFELFTDSPFHFVGSLPPSDHPDLLAVAHSRYRIVDKTRFGNGLRAFETTKVVFGVERRLVVCHSQNLHDKQSRGFDQTLDQSPPPTVRGRRPSRPRTHPQTSRPSRSRDRRDRQAALGVTGDLHQPHRRHPRRATPHVPHQTSRTRHARSRTVRQTDPVHRQEHHPRLDRPDRGRLPLPRSRRSRLPPNERPHRRVVLADVPYTDQKIRVHTFYCVLALMVARLMVRDADHHGLHLSVRELLGTLAGIQETVLLYQGERGRPRARRMLTDINPTQQRLYDLFDLDTYAPKR